MIENKKAKRVWLLGDTHLGIKNNSNEWIDQTREYFFDWFFPLIRKNYQPGDVMIHLGDVYDSRQSINIKVLNLGVDIFEELSNIFSDGVYVIAGNHDLWGKSSNKINSLKSIKWIPNVSVFEDPVTLKLMDKNFFLMPWRKDHNAESETLEYIEPHDVLCCHAYIRGLKLNKYVNVESGAEIDKFKKFTRVYSGHIHYAQKQDNITMLGSPYELTRSDMDNQKSITLLDLSDMNEIVYPNTFSPRFKKFYFNDILESTPDELEPKFRNNFVDVMIDPVMALKAPLSMLTDMIATQRFLKFHPYDPEKTTTLTDQMIESEGSGQFNVLDFIKEYIENLEHDRDTKDKMYQSLVKLHTIVTTQEQESK
jgi:DNA repair exonuclease SbcCD nuclease subunit